MDKDWTGNKNTIFTTLGARNLAKEDREEHDYYATQPYAVELLLEKENFHHHIWECACGEGHISKVLEKHGYEVLSTDLIDRGFGKGGIDFLLVDSLFNKYVSPMGGQFDIVTNPPYKYSLEFVEKSLSVIQEGCKVAMFLKIQFLEGVARRKFFDKYPPTKIYVASNRLGCAKNGKFGEYSTSAICYAWFIWIKGLTNKPTIEWIN